MSSLLPGYVLFFQYYNIIISLDKKIFEHKIVNIFLSIIMPSWADQLLPQFLMEQFDMLPLQYRDIEHMHEGVWFGKNNF